MIDFVFDNVVARVGRGKAALELLLEESLYLLKALADCRCGGACRSTTAAAFVRVAMFTNRPRIRRRFS